MGNLKQVPCHDGFSSVDRRMQRLSLPEERVDVQSSIGCCPRQNSAPPSFVPSSAYTWGPQVPKRISYRMNWFLGFHQKGYSQLNSNPSRNLLNRKKEGWQTSSGFWKIGWSTLPWIPKTQPSLFLRRPFSPRIHTWCFGNALCTRYNNNDKEGIQTVELRYLFGCARD